MLHESRGKAMNDVLLCLSTATLIKAIDDFGRNSEDKELLGIMSSSGLTTSRRNCVSRNFEKIIGSSSSAFCIWGRVSGTLLAIWYAIVAIRRIASLQPAAILEKKKLAARV